MKRAVMGCLAQQQGLRVGREGERRQITLIRMLLAVPRAVPRVLTLTQDSCSTQDIPARDSLRFPLLLRIILKSL